MNHYPRHVGDIITATLGLSLMERGAYTALLDQYYARETALPFARSEIYRLAACTSPAERKAVDYVLCRFFVQEDDGWHQKRCDEEIARYHERSEAARRSINARWHPEQETQYETDTNVSPQPDTNVSPTNAERNSNQNQNQNQKIKDNPKPPTPLPSAAPPAGVRPEVWESWRKTRGKKLTATAVRLQTRFLAEQGGDPNAIIEQSLRNGWAGLFPLKTGSAQSRNDAIQAVNAEIWKGTRGHDDRDITGESERLA